MHYIQYYVYSFDLSSNFWKNTWNILDFCGQWTMNRRSDMWKHEPIYSPLFGFLNYTPHRIGAHVAKFLKESRAPRVSGPYLHRGVADHPLRPACDHGLCKQLAHQHEHMESDDKRVRTIWSDTYSLSWLIIPSCMQRPVTTKVARIHLDRWVHPSRPLRVASWTLPIPSIMIFRENPSRSKQAKDSMHVTIR